MVVKTLGVGAFKVEKNYPELWSYDPSRTWVFEGNGHYLFDDEDDAVQMRLMCS